MRTTENATMGLNGAKQDVDIIVIVRPSIVIQNVMDILLCIVIVKMAIGLIHLKISV